jgi:hypothetical protein
MCQSNQNPIGPPVGKIETRVERFQTGSGQVIEIRWFEKCVMINNILTKESFFEVFPPLRDNRIPESVADIRECICGGLYHKDNILTCPICGRYFCHLCKAEIQKEDSKLTICSECAKAAKQGILTRLIRKIWTLEG